MSQKQIRNTYVLKCHNWNACKTGDRKLDTFVSAFVVCIGDSVCRLLLLSNFAPMIQGKFMHPSYACLQNLVHHFFIFAHI